MATSAKTTSRPDFTAGLTLIVLGAAMTVVNGTAVTVPAHLAFLPPAASNILAATFAGTGFLIVLRAALADRNVMDAFDTSYLGGLSVLLAVLGMAPLAWMLGAPPRFAIAAALLCGAVTALGLGRRRTAVILAPILLWTLVLDPLALMLASVILVGASALAVVRTPWRDGLVAAAALGVAAWIILGDGLGVGLPIRMEGLRAALEPAPMRCAGTTCGVSRSAAIAPRR